MKQLFLLLLCITSFAFAQEELIFSPYGDNAIDSTDENSPVGTQLFRVSLATNSAIIADQITLSDPASFAVFSDSTGSIWITNARIFDYETPADRSLPLTVTIGAVQRTITMTVLPKNDNNFDLTWTGRHIIAEDSVITLNLRTLFSATDADLPADSNYWVIAKIRQEPKFGSFSYDSITETVVYDPSEKTEEFDPNIPDTLVIDIEDWTTYDKNSTRARESATIYFHMTNTNDEPVIAFDDTLIVNEKGIVKITKQKNSSILANDSDLDNEFHQNKDGQIIATSPLTATLISNSKSDKGEFQLATTGAFAYRHIAGSGSDVFQYEVTDGISKDTATVLVQITLLNDNSPTTSFDTLFVSQGGTVSMFRDSSASLFDKISDLDLPNDVITILGEDKSTVSGTASISATGTFSYSHNNERIFEDFFTVQIEDAAGHIVVDTITVIISPAIPGALSVEMIPLNGIMPNQYTFPANMVNSCESKPHFQKGTVCDILLNRPMLESDLQIDLTIIDVVGNVILESSYPNGNNPSLFITRTSLDNRVRVFWETTNTSGRVVGAGTYLLEAVISDTYTCEAIKEQTNWGLMSDLNLIGQ